MLFLDVSGNLFPGYQNIFAFLKKNVMRLHASVFFLIFAINFNYLITNQILQFILCHFLGFTNINNGLPVKLHSNLCTSQIRPFK